MLMGDTTAAVQALQEQTENQLANVRLFKQTQHQVNLTGGGRTLRARSAPAATARHVN